MNMVEVKFMHIYYSLTRMMSCYAYSIFETKQQQLINLRSFNEFHTNKCRVWDVSKKLDKYSTELFSKRKNGVGAFTKTEYELSVIVTCN